MSASAMSASAIQNFHQKFAQSAELRARLKAVESVSQMLTVLQAWNINLTGDQLQALAKSAFDTWVLALNPVAQAFFLQARQDQQLNLAIENCRNSYDVITLARVYGHNLTEMDIQEAAAVAAQIEGFSFEKLWFKGLGLLPA